MEAGEALPVDLHIVGNAHGEAGVLLAAFQSLAEAGLGPRRVGLSLEAVEALDARGVRCGVALDAEGGRLAAIAPGLAARDLERPGDAGARSVRSTRTGQRHPLEGLVGEAVFEGELGRFMPMLRLGELLQVGKHATFGLGRVEVEVLG